MGLFDAAALAAIVQADWRRYFSQVNFICFPPYKGLLIYIAIQDKKVVVIVVGKIFVEKSFKALKEKDFFCEEKS